MTEPIHAASILPVILAGGAGNRLAPLSTPEQPKPFIPLPDGRSLLTMAFQRVANGSIFLPPLLIGQAMHRFALLNHARAACVVPQAILLEPQAKNTAMAIACAASWALTHQPGAVLAILPADQVIEPVDAWIAAVREAAQAAWLAQQICLLGIPPTRAEPCFGYIECSKKSTTDRVQTTHRFIEKPENPEDYMQSALWNAGQFIAPARVIEALMLAHVPEIWMAAQHAVAGASAEYEFTVLGQAAYTGIHASSFDRAVMERAPSLCMPLSVQWHDLGTIAAWEAWTGQPAYATLDRPVRTDRPWGYYELLSSTPNQVEKRLTIFPDCRLSRQRHARRTEIWQVLDGVAEIEIEQQWHRLVKSERIQINVSQWHRLSNSSLIPLIIYEIQQGEPDESDIERSHDDYGRLSELKTNSIKI